MGKRLPSQRSLEEYARVAAERLRRGKTKPSKPQLKSLASSKGEGISSAAGAPAGGRSTAGVGRGMEGEGGGRVPLSEVVSDCVRRWFQDALKEAKAGDAAMQVLVGQMYYNGYGVPKNAQKGKAWITKASRYRSTVWKLSEKHPGYNASDSDSDEERDNAK